MPSDVKPLFVRVTPGEMKSLDLKASQQMRSRANYISLTVMHVISGDVSAPSSYPDAAPSDDSVVLFARVPVEFKDECQRRAQEAGVPLSRWLRGVLFS